jgi:hypothetical protein
MLDLLDAFSALTTLNCVFLFLLLAGVIWTVIVLIGGAVAGVDLPNVDIDVPGVDLPGSVDIPNIDFHVDHDISFDQGSVGVSPLSPITIASFDQFWGRVIGTRLLRLPDLSACFSAALAPRSSLAACSRQPRFGRREALQHRTYERHPWRQAEVIVPSPRMGCGRGAVTWGVRSTWSARSADSKAAARDCRHHRNVDRHRDRQGGPAGPD